MVLREDQLLREVLLCVVLAPCLDSFAVHSTALYNVFTQGIKTVQYVCERTKKDGYLSEYCPTYDSYGNLHLQADCKYGQIAIGGGCDGAYPPEYGQAV